MTSVKQVALKNAFPGIVLAALLASAWSAHAATYNIYFNNAEQGNNSTAKPTVIVEDSKGSAAKKEEAQAPLDQGPEPASAPSAQPATRTETREDFHEVTTSWNHTGYRFRVMAGGAYNAIHANEPGGVFDADPNSSLPFWEQTHDNSSQGVAPQVEGTMFLDNHFGATLIVGNLIGFEGIIEPFGVDTVSFIQPELSIGVMSLPSKFSASSGPTVGAKLAFNLSPSVALIVGGRSTILRNSEFNFAQGSAGIAYNF